VFAFGNALLAAAIPTYLQIFAEIAIPTHYGFIVSHDHSLLMIGLAVDLSILIVYSLSAQVTKLKAGSVFNLHFTLPYG
jgi:hypothetical protein